MLVNASASPAPALWQGLMLIGILIWVFMSFDNSTRRYATIVLVAWTVFSSAVTFLVFRQTS